MRLILVLRLRVCIVLPGANRGSAVVLPGVRIHGGDVVPGTDGGSQWSGEVKSSLLYFVSTKLAILSMMLIAAFVIVLCLASAAGVELDRIAEAAR